VKTEKNLLKKIISIEKNNRINQGSKNPKINEIFDGFVRKIILFKPQPTII
jgi:hypothetical protein